MSIALWLGPALLLGMLGAELRHQPATPRFFGALALMFLVPVAFTLGAVPVARALQVMGSVLFLSVFFTPRPQQ